MEEITSDEFACSPWEREAFNVNYHGPMTDAELAKHREFECGDARAATRSAPDTRTHVLADAT